MLEILLKAMKSKGLVIAGIVLIIISLIFGAYFAPIYRSSRGIRNKWNRSRSGCTADHICSNFFYWSRVPCEGLYLSVGEVFFLLGSQPNTRAINRRPTLLQFNAAIIVGVLFFLSLSSSLFGQKTSSQAQSR